MRLLSALVVLDSGLLSGFLRLDSKLLASLSSSLLVPIQLLLKVELMQLLETCTKTAGSTISTTLWRAVTGLETKTPSITWQERPQLQSVNLKATVCHLVVLPMEKFTNEPSEASPQSSAKVVKPIFAALLPTELDTLCSTHSLTVHWDMTVSSLSNTLPWTWSCKMENVVVLWLTTWLMAP